MCVRKKKMAHKKDREREQRKKKEEGREAEIEKVRQGKGDIIIQFLCNI